jgi:hypothetical protein
MKKLFVLTTMCIITMLFTNKAMSQVVASGTTGDCTWELTGTSGNYTLTISGTGAMGNYYSDGISPWYSYRTGLKTLNLQQGVTTIGNSAFRDCSGLTELHVKAQTPPALGVAVFNNVPATIPVHIPSSKRQKTGCIPTECRKRGASFFYR